jgi:hypothetical protein
MLVSDNPRSTGVGRLASVSAIGLTSVVTGLVVAPGVEPLDGHGPEVRLVPLIGDAASRHTHHIIGSSGRESPTFGAPPSVD